MPGASSGGGSSSYGARLRPSDVVEGRVHKLRRKLTDVTRHAAQLDEALRERQKDVEVARANLMHVKEDQQSVREQQQSVREELLEAEEEEAEEERKMRHEKFKEDIDNPCYICRDNFSETTGTSSFSLVSYKCKCTGNARMVHLNCWASYPGQQTCGICKGIASLVDARGRKFKVSIEVDDDAIDVSSDEN